MLKAETLLERVVIEKTTDFHFCLQGGMVDVHRLEFVLNQLQFHCHRLINGNERDIWTTLMVSGDVNLKTVLELMNANARASDPIASDDILTLILTPLSLQQAVFSRGFEL